MNLFRRSNSVSAKLTRMNLLVSGTVLILAALAFFSYDLFSFRQNLIRNLQTEAQIAGLNSVSALMFDDAQSAATTLQSLRRSPDVVSAVLTRNSGKVFARYQARKAHDMMGRHLLGSNEEGGAWSQGNHVLVAHRIRFQGNSVGVVYISATLMEIGQRARHYVVIAGIILLFCMAAALLISSASRRLVAQPIISLANTARAVTREKDYSVRAAPQSDGSEIATLIDAFNGMLEQIQQRDRALSRARDELETRVKERTAELQTANRELEAFSYTVAHDLRGPLDAITGMAFLLERANRSGDSGRSGEILEQLKMSTANMAVLIDDLLNFARATTAQLKTETVDLTAIAREICVELTRSEPNRVVEFAIGEMPAVKADEGLMRVVMDNLMRNAWKYTSRRSRSRIEVGAKQSAGKPVYFVRDDGAGFDPSRKERLFEPFQRLHSKSEFPGTGIGLATVQRILARQGGNIWAEGAVGKGATFYFSF